MEKILDDENCYIEGTELQFKMDKMTNLMERAIAPYILKISGGEIFLIKGITSYLKKFESRYKRIQVLTNGTLLNRELIKELSQIRNLSLQISLDGHTLELNGYRVKNEKSQEKMRKILELCNEYQLSVEVNCVITNRNIVGIYDFVEYISQFRNILFLPYPVRGKMKDDFFPRNTQLGSLKKLVDDYEKFKSSLPPKAYMKELLDYLTTGKSQEACYIPNIILQSFDDGIITPCPNIWFRSLGNILEDEEKINKNIHRPHFTKFVQKSRKFIKECEECFTPWDILNLFFRDRISYEELSLIYLYNDPEILIYLQELKNDFLSREGINSDKAGRII